MPKSKRPEARRKPKVPDQPPVLTDDNRVIYSTEVNPKDS